MKHIFLTTAFLSGFAISLYSQGRIDRGDRAFQKLAFEKAITKYEHAKDKGEASPHLYARLGECYRMVNKPDMAASNFARLMKYDHDPMYDLHYGQVLMALGKYQDAEPYLENYRIKHPKESRVNNLISACANGANREDNLGLYSLIPTHINSKASDFGPVLHEGALYFSSARQTSPMHFSWDGSWFLDIYKSEITNGYRLKEPKALKSRVNSRFHEAIPTFSKEEERMLFTRNNFRRGKIGFSDDRTIHLKIYEAEKRRKKWRVKSEFPFNSDDYSVGHPTWVPLSDTIYFASDMPGGQGGVDLYYSVFDNGSWQKPVNLGPEVNTEGDEMFPWVGKDRQLIFASNGHQGFGGLDLFSVKLNGNSAIKHFPAPINSISDDFQLVFDPGNGIGYFTSNREGGEGSDDIYTFRKHQLLGGTVANAETGNLLQGVAVKIVDTRHTVGVPITDLEGVFKRGLKPGAYWITFEKDGFETHSERVQVLANEAPDLMAIKLKPKTDCEEGVVLVRGKTLQSGKIKPDTRVVVKVENIVVESDEQGGFELPLAKGGNYNIYIDEPGLKQPVAENLVIPSDHPDELYDFELDFEVKASGEPFFVIYYDLDKSNIRSYDARPELDRVVDFMNRRSEIRVALSSHTDSRAGTNYNLALSEKRAQEAFSYLVSQGIAKDRLTFNWFGEEKPVNKCIDGIECSEREHQLNRRTEFRIVD